MRRHLHEQLSLNSILTRGWSLGGCHVAVLYLLVHTGVAAIIMVDDMYSFIYSLAIIMVQNYIYIMPCEPMMLNQLPIVPLNDSHQPISFVTFYIFLNSL